MFWYSRPEGFMPPQGETAPGPDPTVDEWRKLIDRHGFDALAVQADASAGLYSYLGRLPRETPARALGALLAVRTPLEAVCAAHADPHSGLMRAILIPSARAGGDD